MGTAGTSSGHNNSSNHVSLDVDELARSMREDMKSLRPFSDECCIYRVPERLRQLNEKAYTPQVVSIGPFHHGEEKFRAMEYHKSLYLQEFLQWTEVSLEKFIKFIEERETRLRNCYAETIELSSVDFVRMMLLDAVLVIWFLLKYSLPMILTENDRIFGKSPMIYSVRYDMCLLENQLPFFILGDLLELSAIFNHHQDWSMIKLTYKFLKGVWGSWVTMNILQTLNVYKVKHFVDFLSICQKPLVEVNRPMELLRLTIPSVTELRQAGVKFKLMPLDKGNWQMHDIRFCIDKGILKIPRLTIINETEILLRNLQAFEQCHSHQIGEGYISNYAFIMDKLVCSIKDVEMLVQEGILTNVRCGNDAVLSLFHSLSTGAVFNRYFYFSSLVEDLDEYYKMHKDYRLHSHKWKASLKQNYFYSPWAIVSVIAAFILLILTVIQTVCSIIQVA